jgi:NACHT domain
MAKFSDAEIQLLQGVKDDRLQTSLTLIRQAAEDIWASDAPRIIKDYTDHGIAHYERIAGFANSLLNANDGRPLSSRESYLLMAGIYLHDVGMQCDVVKFPEIQKRATALGAHFEAVFKSPRSSDYDVDEQKAIRKNHQYLSAAWIDHAYRTGNSVLGVAAKSIPEELVDDVMDVCKHHTKVPITDCPTQFKFDQSNRKQLVAALLRFADELDIDSRRVSIETVKTFSLDPGNSIYWWIHNRTTISFSSRSVVSIVIRLSPADIMRHGQSIHVAFITEFQSKNRPVLTVLGQNGVPIVVSDDSKVIADERAEDLPPDIRNSLKAIEKRKDPLRDLAEEVRIWLRAVRYETSDISRQGNRTADMVATLDLGTVKQRVVVRCVGGEITAEDVDELDKLLSRRTPQGWLISDKRVAKAARERVSGDDALQVFTLAEFLKQKVWGPYFDSLTALVAKERIPDFYVDVGCFKQELNARAETVKEAHSSLETYIDSWLKERGKMHISLLGSFGTGKTWFCRHYAITQLQRYLDDPANQRLPLLVTLRSFAKAMTAEQLINDALLEQYKLQFIGSAFEIFQEMNRRGKLLLILDGFDEMARQVDYQTVVDNFWELARLVDEHSKVILTSRTEYFRWAEESKKIFAGEEFGRKILFLEPPKFEVIYLEAFSDKQIKEVITKRIGILQSDIADRILKNQNLAEMARRPVLIELLLAALQEVSANVLESPGQVYLYATNKLLLRNIDTRRTFTTTADKVFFLCELAWEMIKTDTLRIHYGAIPDRIKTYFGEKIRDQHELDMWDFDLRNQTLLHRDAAGYYEFAHKSLAEYFVAFKFSAELGCMERSFAEAYREADGRACNLAVKPRETMALPETVGAHSFSSHTMVAIFEFLREMIDNKRTDRLWQLVEQTRGKTRNDIFFLAANTITLLGAIGQSFMDRDLSGLSLYQAIVPHDLRGINLRGAQALGVDFSNRDLRGSDLTDCIFNPGSLAGADLRSAKGINDTFFELVQPKATSVSHLHHYIGTVDWLGWTSVKIASGLNEDYALESDQVAKPLLTELTWHDAPLHEVSTKTNFEKFLTTSPTNVFVITGSRGIGKSSLLLSTSANASRSLLYRAVFYYDMLGIRPFWPDSRTSTFYRQLATFLSVAGYDHLYSFLSTQQLLDARSRLRGRVTVNALPVIFPAFEKEKLLICIDDVLGDEEDEVFSFLKFFANRRMATKIVAVMQQVPSNLLGQVKTIELNRKASAATGLKISD